MKRMTFMLLLVCLIPVNSWGTSVTVFFEPQNSVVNVGDQLTINLKANIPDPVVGWGLDVSFDSSILSFEDVTVGSSWFTPASNIDGDGLVGLAFPSISHDDILLATLKFQALSLGTSLLEASYTQTDPTEGFPLGPGGFANVNFIDGSVTTVPEPATMLLLSSGLAGLVGFRKKLRNG